MIGRPAPLALRASVHLDLLRGVAALAVMAGHVRGLFFEDFQSLGGGARPVLAVVYGATALGHEAVMVFFVLSGFFVGGSVINSLGRWSWRPYVVNRLSRLLIVLVPALLLTAAIDALARTLPAGPLYYAHPIANLGTEPFDARRGAATFAGNLLFLQNIFVRPFGSNTALWSLSNEFWYYVLFPLGAVAALARAPRGGRVIAAAILAGLCLWLPPFMLAAFAIWCFGVVVYLLPAVDSRRHPRAAWAITIGFGASLPVALVFAALHRLPSSWADFVVGVTAAGAVYAIARVERGPRRSSAVCKAVAHRLSGCSYSLYAVHLPIVMLIRVAAGPARWAPTAASGAWGAAIVAGVVGSAMAFAAVTEAHTDGVRRWMTRRLHIGRPAGTVGASATFDRHAAVLRGENDV